MTGEKAAGLHPILAPIMILLFLVIAVVLDTLATILWKVGLMEGGNLSLLTEAARRVAPKYSQSLYAVGYAFGIAMALGILYWAYKTLRSEE